MTTQSKRMGVWGLAAAVAFSGLGQFNPVGLLKPKADIDISRNVPVPVPSSDKKNADGKSKIGKTGKTVVGLTGVGALAIGAYELEKLGIEHGAEYVGPKLDQMVEDAENDALRDGYLQAMQGGGK